MAKKGTTTDELAVMINRGFEETAKKKDLDEVKIDLADVKDRVENIEKLLLKQYNFEIKELKQRVKRMEDLFAMK